VGGGGLLVHSEIYHVPIGDGWEEVLVRNVLHVLLCTSTSSSLNIMSLPGIEHAPPDKMWTLYHWAMKDIHESF
jgi:hypothetical protein